MSLIPFSASSPFHYPVLPAEFSVGSSTAFLTSLVLSPLPLYWVLSQYKEWYDRKVYSYMREVIPKPENPDGCSIKGAMEDELDGETIAGLGSMKDYNEFEHREPTTLLGEIRKDLCAMVQRLRAAAGFRTAPPEDEEDMPVDEPDSPVVYIEHAEINPQASLEPEGYASQSTPPSIQLPEPHPGFSPLDLDDDDIPAPPPEPAAPADQPTSPSSSLASAEATIPEPSTGPTAVQVTTHAGSTDTLHMNVEIAGRVPGAAPLYTSSFSASPRPAVVETASQLPRTGKSFSHHRPNHKATSADPPVSQIKQHPDTESPPSPPTSPTP